MRIAANKMMLGFAIASAVPVATVAVAQIATTNVIFPRGMMSTTISGVIVGRDVRDYAVRARAGQSMRVSMAGSSIVYFNVLPPGSNDVAIFVGSNEGNDFRGTLSRSGVYKIRVYQMRATARRGERGRFRLNIAVNGQGGGPGGPPPGGGGPGGGGPGGGGGGRGLAGIAGMDSIAAIDEMSRRGFANVDDMSSGNTQYGIFYHRGTRLCAQLTMANGRVLDARDIRTHPKCR